MYYVVLSSALQNKEAFTSFSVHCQCKSCDCHHYAQLQVSVQSNLRRVIQATGSVAEQQYQHHFFLHMRHECVLPVEYTEEDEADQSDA